MKTPLLLLLLAAPVAAQLPPSAVEEKFRSFDTNGDGAIAGEEMKAAEYLPRLDLDKNGSLTLEEAVKALRGRSEEVVRNRAGNGLFQQLDKNGDGVLTAEELPKRQWFSALDRDGNGKVNFEEAEAAVTRLRRAGEILPSTAEVKPADEDPHLKEAPLVLKAAEHGVGRLAAEFGFIDSKGEAGTVSERLKGSHGLLIAFFGPDCPISKKFGPELARLEDHCTAQGVKFLLVCPIAAATSEEMAKFAADHALKGPLVHDRDGAIRTALGATTTTEVFLIDAGRTLVYRGAINDQYGLGYSKEKAQRAYLRDALAAMLRHEAPLIAATTAPGCALDTPASAVTGPGASEVTYHRQVSRILQANCVECHRTGGVGPFSLATYDDVIKNAGMIRKQVERGVMPPWFAAPVSEGHSPWGNDRALAPQDKADLLAWLASSRPLGDPAEAPLPRKFPEEWSIGQPEAVVQLPSPVKIKAEGTLPYQFITVATDFEEDRWVRGYEILPTDRSVVHHVIVQVHPKGEKITNRGEGAGGYWAAYVPGNASHVYPDGFAKKLPAGATLSFQIHYTPNGKATEDQLKMGLLFAKEPPRYVVNTTAVANLRLNIPAGAANHVEVAERTLPADMNIMAYMAHMHVRGKAFKFEVTLPGGKEETLLDIPRYDFNWQLRYDYAQPRFLPRGSRVKITALYDNSEGNPANPDPARNVRWGQQTFDEMMIGYLEYYTPVAGEVAGR
jgi:Ca2+-binding EF-hand superfamily protein/mono/diheme cytochrome c family protein/peroxiredoxin